MPKPRFSPEPLLGSVLLTHPEQEVKDKEQVLQTHGQPVALVVLKSRRHPPA